MNEIIEIPKAGIITKNNALQIFDNFVINLADKIASPNLYIFANGYVCGIFWALWADGKIKKEIIEKFRIKQSMSDSELSVFILIEEDINNQLSFYLKELIKIS